MSEQEPIVFRHNLPEDKARQLVEALREVHDPEIPINVYDLGLIREVRMNDDGSAKVVMTLTAVGCPVSANIAQEVGLVVQQILGASDVEVEVDLENPWKPTDMTPRGRELFKAIYGYDIVEQYQSQQLGE